MWLGGTARSALRRAGELADGWLPSLCPPEEASAGRAAIEAYASAANRTVDPEHFGISLTYARENIPEGQRLRIQRRRPDLDPAQVVPVGFPVLRELLQRYIDVGFSKFVLRPAEPRGLVSEELRELAEGVLTLQT